MQNFLQHLSSAAALLLPFSVCLGTTQPLGAQGLEADSTPAFRCVQQAQRTATPPPPPPSPASTAAATATTIETLSPVCSTGSVPRPLERYAPKGIPRLRQAGNAQIQLQSLTYLYTSAYQYYSAVGTSANFSQHKPGLPTSDFHSLAEIAGQSSDGKQIVEVGWTVDRAVNNGDTNPHLFVFHWVNSVGACYNGCGWVQVSNRRYPGMRVTVTNTPQKYAIQYFQGRWWIWYQTEWIGYFPGSLWSGKFTRLGLTQWFGEVAANRANTCTDMGNGLFGSNRTSAVVKNIFFINGPYASPSYLQTKPAYYNIGGASGSNFRYGGPGGC